MMDPREFILGVARKAAANTESSLAEVFHRAKSQAYLFGRLQRAFPELDAAELKELIASLRKEAAEDPASKQVAARPTRPPSRGREPVGDPKWDARLVQLQCLIDVPLTTSELLERAKRELGWDKSFFQAAIAASESRSMLEYQPPHWMPAAQKERVVSKANRVRVRQCTRQVECIVDEQTERQLIEQQKLTNSKRGMVISRLSDESREIRRRHRSELEEKLGPLRAEKLRLERELQSLVDQLSSGTVQREVSCEERLDYETGTVITVRLDTRDIVDRRPLSHEERQIEMEGA